MGSAADPVVVTIRMVMHHTLSFRASDLPDGYGECLNCGARVDIEAWLYESCPAKEEQ